MAAGRFVVAVMLYNEFVGIGQRYRDRCQVSQTVAARAARMASA